MNSEAIIKDRHIIKADQFDRAQLEEVFHQADVVERMQSGNSGVLSKYIMASLFYEASTRTRLSFESAMLKLGGSVIGTENAREFSSAIKGESLEDSIRVIGNYADVIVLRHHEKGASERAASVSPVPVINAGDGAGEHPTQALLDLYTIKREIGYIDDVTVLMMGDLKYGRTVRSLAHLLCRYENVKLLFVSPPELRIENDVRQYLSRHAIEVYETSSLKEVVSCADIVYQTRIQKERLQTHEEKQTSANVQDFYIDNYILSRMKPSARVMHPLPRNDEISPEVDSCKKAVYFKQTYYGLLVRKALLKAILRG